MVQGTTSDAGKSILVTALCRLLARWGFSVAPFKPQNMALNSAVAIDGGEIGHAQAVQAAACYLQPSVDMNPVLLKPNSDKGSQIIVNGRAIGNMDAQEYHRFKPKLLSEVVNAYQRLQNQYQAVFIEGAGSPAEINLREHDIANMGFAEAVDCPVIIVADIDRGGVFAHLYGTYSLLSPSEQQRVVGFVINRFRGDVNLLTPGLVWLTEKTTVPVLGVIPYIPNLHIEAEDSITASQQHQSHGSDWQQLRVVVPLYPRASNHTDFDVLRMIKQVDCQLLKNAADFNGADVIILPGSKSVRGDLQWLRDSGWAALIYRHLRLGGKVMGRCGGYQMLGNRIHDPKGIESEPGSSEGLGLLDIETTLADNKTLNNIAGKCTLSGAVIKGYEIHAGTTTGKGLDKPAFIICEHQLNNSEYNDGAISADGNIIGTYIHGVFDHPDMQKTLFSWVGQNIETTLDYEAFRDNEIDRLADIVEQSLEKETLLRILQLDHKAAQVPL